MQLTLRGAARTSTPIAALLALALGLTTLTAPATHATSAPGAAVLADNPRDDPAGAPVDVVESITPEPLYAYKDVPSAYPQGCQVGPESSTPIKCVFGSTTSRYTVAVVGDSKVLQWISALDRIGKARGWRVITYTKSACAFAAAETMLKGSVYKTCTEWNSRVRDALLRWPPQMIVTSQAAAVAKDGSGTSTTKMVDGLRMRWRSLLRGGVKDIVVLQDNQSPGARADLCAHENRTRLTRCAFARGRSPAGQTQRTAAYRQSGVTLVDLTDAICPTASCAVVIGNVLIYRIGSHLTATYVNTMTPRLDKRLVAVKAS